MGAARVLLVCGLLLAVVARAAPLPEPLRLEDALRLARDEAPELLDARAERQAGEAALRAGEARDALRLDLRARLWAVQPAARSDDRQAHDSNARLVLRKRLFDAGYGEAADRAAAHRLRAAEWALREARQQRHLEIMRAFFDVLLADLEFARDNEAMSVAFVRFDQGRERQALGRLSDVELLELEHRYQQTRRAQVRALTRQRLARARLALAMGRPGELASDLVMPEIEPPADAAAPGDFEAFWARVRERHPRLRRLAELLAAARAEVEAARRSVGPVLRARLEAGAWVRDTTATHPLRGGLELELPLVRGGARDAAVARAEAALTRARAQHEAALRALRQEALDRWLRRESLRAELEALRVEGDYRELYLDRSRALYELEVRTDLGDAMTRISAVRLETARKRFEWAMNEAAIEAMTDRLLEKAP